jgi:hypothetical protein
MTTHLGLMATFALFVSVVFATIMRDAPADQVRLGARMFAAFIGGAVLVGWLLYPLPL